MSIQNNKKKCLKFLPLSIAQNFSGHFSALDRILLPGNIPSNFQWVI